MIIPVFIASFYKIFNGDFEIQKNEVDKKSSGTFMLSIGLILILSVPIFKTITHLPPYLGMLLALGIFAVIAEIKSNRNFTITSIESSVESPTLNALGKIEMPSILFFLGILMTIASMESMGIIFKFGDLVRNQIPLEVFAGGLGVISSIIDNVPLVAASIGMFSEVEMDDTIWHLIAYSAGTGGSLLIIGSAAGVVAMGMENISFGWYLKKISLLAAIGYISGYIFLILIT
jgi:Na+/H+ antiporter NhaD/arsenite permease-like protein